MEATLLPPSFTKDMHTFQCAITSNGATPVETFGYPMFLHSLAKNVMEEESCYKNPPFGLNFVPTCLQQQTNDTRF
jgi:hypothetical protein